MTDTYTQYGAPLSLYSGKTRAYLRFKQLPFTEVMATVKVYKQVIIPNTGLRYIPVLKTPNGKYIQDTSVIIDYIEANHKDRSAVPTTPNQHLVSALFEMWADEWLLIPAMHYRWNHDNFPFIYEEFGKFVMPKAPAFIRRVVGKKAGAKFKGFVPMLGITNNSIAAIENWYENEVLPMLDAHFAKHDYLLGSRPCVGDFALFGPLYAHLYRDPAPGKIMQRIAPNVVRWIERMHAPPDEFGQWCVSDRIPQTLIPLLKQQFDQFWPVQLDTLARTQTWITTNPETKRLPRALGEHDFSIGNITEKRVVTSFGQWKLQRVLDIYQALSEQQKHNVDPMLHELGAYHLMQTAVEHRVTRENNVLVVEGR